MFNSPMVRMEKRAVNKIGLILTILLAIAALVGGGYFLYKNRNNIDFSFPWSKANKEKKAEEEKAKKGEEKVALERQKVAISEYTSYTGVDITITPRTIEYDDKEGYKIQLLVNNTGKAIDFELYCIDIDGYQVDYYNEFTAQSKNPHVVTVVVSKEKLDLYKIETFKKLRIFIRKKGTKPSGTSTLSTIIIRNKEAGDNVQQPDIISNVGNADAIKIDYYRKEETDDETNIYFLVTNNQKSLYNYYTLIINAYKVNGEIITDNNFKEEVYDTDKKIVKLSIPKSKYKSVDSLTVSFFARRNDDIYTTKATTIEFNK